MNNHYKGPTVDGIRYSQDPLHVNRRRLVAGAIATLLALTGGVTLDKSLNDGKATDFALQTIYKIGDDLSRQFEGVKFSEETQQIPVQPGDSLWTIAQLVDGYGTVPTDEIVNIIALMNSDIVGPDGLLQPGETLTIPVSVS